MLFFQIQQVTFPCQEVDVRHGEGEEIEAQDVNGQSPAVLSPMICLLSQVHPKVAPGRTSATYCNKTHGKTTNVRNAQRLCVLSRLLGAMCHGNNAAKADF